MIDEQSLWEQVKDLLKASLDDSAFNQVVNCLKLYKYQNGYLYLIADNSLNQFRIESFYLAKMNKLLHQVADEKISFKIITKSEFDKTFEENMPEVVESIPQAAKLSVIKERVLRPEYTFESFVTGEANREAFLYSTKVAESPAVTINPFYIFGDVGLGKTHLMSAIGHYFIKNKPDAKVIYTTAQQFIDDFYKSKSKGVKDYSLASEFDNYYRSADLFLVDDVQYLADKQATQDEFFKLFEYLFENNKQIVITSDRPASELNIMSRLKSRFSWGMQADIKKPNLELRKRILKKKAPTMIAENTELPDDVIEFIANNFDENIRELEGALRRFVMYCVSFNTEFSLENAKIALENIIRDSQNDNSRTGNNVIEKVKSAVSSYFRIDINELSSSSRKQELVYARNLVIYILKNDYNLTLNKIGSVLGGRDHTSIIHSIDKTKRDLETDVNVKEDLNNVKAIIAKM